MSIHKGDYKVTRNSQSRSITLGKNATVVSASTLTLDSFSPTFQIFTGTTLGQIVNLGDATGYVDLGLVFILINDSTQDLIVENNAGTDLFTLKPNFSLLVFLEDNTTANGGWRFALFVDRTLQELAESSRGGMTCGFDGNASTGRWLEFYANNPSDDNPLVIPEPSRLRALSISSPSNSTGTVTIFKNGVALETISLAASQTNRKKDLTHNLTDLDELSVQVTSGSISRPMVVVFIQTF